MRRIYLKHFDSVSIFSGENLYRYSLIIGNAILLCMKTLPFQRDPAKNQVNVDCAGGSVSVYSSCAYCRYCRGIHMSNRLVPPPQIKALADIREHGASDEILMTAAMQFNTLVRDGSAIECADEKNEGYQRLF